MTRARECLSRRSYLPVLSAPSTDTAELADCLGDDDGTGILATYITDPSDPIVNFDSCLVSITGFWLGPEGEDRDDGGTEPADRECYEYDEPQEAGFVELQGGNTQLVGMRALDVSTCEFLQLDTHGINAIFENGSSATVEVRREAPLTFYQQFEIKRNTRTGFAADFTPVRRGQTESYVLQPVPAGITVSHEEE